MSDFVCDASALVALLLDSGKDGAWAADTCRGAALAGPALVRFEAANIVRRSESARLISADQAAQAHADLLALPITEWPYELLADRAWQLRHNLTVYDGAYVALAELLSVPLATLDRRLAKAPGPRCTILTPPA